MAPRTSPLDVEVPFLFPGRSGSNLTSCGALGPPPARTPSLGEQGVELGIALQHASVHPAGHDGVPDLDGLDHGGLGDSCAAATQVLEDRGVEGNPVGRALPGEGLDQPLVRAYLMERAVERGDL